MKVIKTLKNLKFWSKKKRKRKINSNIINHNSPPQGYYYHHRHHHQYDNFHTIAAQPSAPPLPSWLDYEQQTYNQHLLASDEVYDVSPGLPVSYQAQFNPEQDDNSNVTPDPNVVNVDLLAAAGSGGGEILETRCSYQQYMDENLVYGVPVLTSIKTKRSGGAVGCVFNVGGHLFRCFFPCFRIQDV